MKIKVLRRIQLFWMLFIGLGAIFGGICMLIDPSGRIMGMDVLLPYFQKLPFADKVFNDYTFSGISLIIVNGLTQLFSAGLLFARHRFASHCSAICGILLMLWICIQFYMFPINFMDIAYFIFGLAEMLFGIYMIKKEHPKAEV